MSASRGSADGGALRRWGVERAGWRSVRIGRRHGDARPGPDGQRGSRECPSTLGSVESQALAVEAVDHVAVLQAVEGDRVDQVLPGQRADLDLPPGGLEPVAEPVVALAGVVLDPAPDLA